MIARRLAWLCLVPALAGCDVTSQLKGKTAAATYVDDGARINKRLGLITPEQFLGNIRSTLGFDDQYVLSDVLRDKMVALGGVDFREATTRRRTPTAGTALTIRRLAFDIASKVVEADANAAAAGKPGKTFQIASVGVDRPLNAADLRLPAELQIALKEGDQRYRRQLDDLYFRLLSRPPSDAETQTMSSLFATVAGAESDARVGWTAVLFVLLASMEYWNI